MAELKAEAVALANGDRLRTMLRRICAILSEALVRRSERQIA